MEEHRSGYRQCQICTSNKRINIDREIIKGTTYAAISRTYQVSRYTVSNHATNHLSHQLMRAHNTQDALNAESLISDFNFLISKTKEILAQAEEKQWLNTGLAAIRELRSCWESWVKIGSNLMTYKESQRLREIEQEKEELRAMSREELEQLEKDLEAEGEEDDYPHEEQPERLGADELIDSLVTQGSPTGPAEVVEITSRKKRTPLRDPVSPV